MVQYYQYATALQVVTCHVHMLLSFGIFFCLQPQRHIMQFFISPHSERISLSSCFFLWEHAESARTVRTICVDFITNILTQHCDFHKDASFEFSLSFLCTSFNSLFDTSFLHTSHFLQEILSEEFLEPRNVMGLVIIIVDARKAGSHLC